MRVRQALKPLKMQPALTPLIDVIFNLLMFFLLTPSASAGEGYLTTNLPKSAGPVAGIKPIDEVRLKIELYDVGPNGKFVENGRNDYCSITVNQQDLGGNFEALQALLEGMRERGLSPNTAILISPTMGTLHEWVVRAFDSIVAARFSNVQFAVPYGDQ